MKPMKQLNSTVRGTVAAAHAVARFLFCVVVAGSVVSGCAYSGGKVVEGTDLAAGISVPTTDGIVNLNVLNYLSGFMLGVYGKSIFKVKYTVDENNTYLGIVTIKSKKTIDAEVEPCENTVKTNP